MRLHRAVLRLAAPCGLALLGIGCLARQAAELQRRMTGVPVRALQGCLGVPSSFERVDGREVWLYDLPYRPPRDDVTIDMPKGPGGLGRSPNVTSGEVAREALTGTRTSALHSGVAPGHCLLVFELEQGAVRRFRSAGRNANGMTVSAECTMLARHCPFAP